MVMRSPGVLQPWAYAITRRPRGHPGRMGITERLIGSIRRECLDHFIVFGDAHLRRILAAYAAYNNDVRTHLALAKDAPLLRPIQQFGQITVRPILGGLHHQYCRI
jgi:Integrase core domain